MHQNLGGAALAAFLLNAAQHVDRGVFGAADMAGAAAMRAGDEAGFGQRRAQTLPAHFQQAEMADVPDLDAGAVVLQRVLDAPFDHRVVALGLHVDEVDDDQAGEVAQTQLAGRFVGGLQIGAQRCFLNIPLARRTSRVHVDRDQSLGLVDDQIPAGAQLHDRLQHRIELGFHLAASK